MITVKKAAWLVVLSLLIFVGAWYFINGTFNKQSPITLAATPIKNNQRLSAFKLTDYNDRVFDNKSLRGHWTLVFFGYTNCPDICPATLNLVREAWSHYNVANPPPARFVFANLAPTPIETSTLKQFLANYNPNFMGVTGSKSEMQKFSDQLGIYFVEQNGSFDHTASLMLIDPQGKLAAIFTPPFSAEELVKDLKLLTHT